MLVGQQIGPFEIERELGSGAMGTVYRARYTKTGQFVAIKMIALALGTNERVLARFEREADMLKQLKHPNIVRILATGKYRNTPFYAMEYIQGETLEQVLLRKERMSWGEVVVIGKQVCSALEHVHAQGIIHRDLKPSNIMVMADGTIKLTDFGIAKDLDVTQLTSANCTVGTASYMSPEQCKGDRNLTSKSDLYSLGVMLFELLTGRKPFLAESALDMFMMHVKGKFERPARLVLDIPVWLDTLVCQLLEKKPEHRPKDAAMVAHVLDEVLEKVETQKSAGVTAATKVLRKGKDEAEKELARTLLGRTKKDRRDKPPRGRKEFWLQVGGLTVLLLAGVVLLTLALWPASAEKLYQQGVKLVEEGDKHLERGDTYEAWQSWDRARTKYLQPALEREPDGPATARVKEQLLYLEAADLYRKGKESFSGKKEKNWEGALEKGYQELLDKFPKGKDRIGRNFVEKAAADLEEFHAPVLLKKAEDAEAKKRWKEADESLKQLARYYPKSRPAEEVPKLLEQRLREKMRSRTPIPDHAEGAALRALQESGSTARQYWEELVAEYRDQPEASHWVMLAEKKLQK